MGDTHGDARLLRGTKWKDRKRVDMTVDNLPALLFKEALELSLIFDYMLVGRNFENSAAERFNLLARHKRGVRINQEIELNFTTIDMTVIVHNDRFDTAAKHLAHDLGDADRFFLAHRPVLLLPNMAPKVPVKHLQSMRKQRFRT